MNTQKIIGDNLAEGILNDMINLEKNVTKTKKQITINGISLYRILAYFAIYSVLGYVLETLFALAMYGKLESRQGFLYGPVCPIYGVGAVVMIVALQKLKKNGYSIFAGGIIVGSIVEYFISWFGEVFLNVRWWDYTGRFLNINGRICLLYSFYWGIISIYLMKSLNPAIDKIINFAKSKINIKVAKISTIAITIFLLIDCLVSAYAVELFLARTVVEKEILAKGQEEYLAIYEEYSQNAKNKKLIDKIWSNKKVLRTYPNIRLTLKNGEIVKVQDYYPEIQPYYYQFR